MECLDGLVSIINDQDTRTSGVLYLNDLPEFSIDKMSQAGNEIFCTTTLGSPTLTNITMNTSNFSVGDDIEGHNIPAGTTILATPTATTITMSANATATDDKIAIYSNAAGNKLVSDIISFAQAKMEKDVIANLQGCLKRNTVLRNNVAGSYRDFTNTSTAADAKRRGVQIKTDRFPYTEIYIHKVRLFLDTGIVGGNLLIYDLISSTLLDTISFTNTADEITDVIVNRAYGSDKQEMNIIIVYDGSLAAGYQSTIGRKRCSGCSGSDMVTTYGIQIDTADDVVEANIEAGSETYGMSVTYSLNCTVEPFLCSIRNLLQFPLLYLSAGMLMEHARYDQRINSFINLGKVDHGLLADKYNQEYNVQMFGGFNEDGTKKIKQGIMDTLAMPQDICFKSRPKIRNTIQVP